MQLTINETNRRREIQIAYNTEHGITPQQIRKAKGSALNLRGSDGESKAYIEPERISIAAEPKGTYTYQSIDDLKEAIVKMKKMMSEAAKKLEFLEAAQYRDELIKLEDTLYERTKKKGRLI